MLKKIFTAGILFVLLAGLLTGCSGTQKSAENTEPAQSGEKPVDNQVINIKGSDTMVYLSKALAEEFMKRNQGTQLAVVGGGSGTGIKALIAGTADIANASRKMKPEEIEEARSKGIEPIETTVALDGLAIVVNMDNPVTQLNLAQLKDIFTGKITNWQQVGGKNEPVTVISREANSGSHVYFREHVLKDEAFTANAVLVQTSKGVTEETVKLQGAIGYVGVGDAKAGKNIKILNIAKDAGTEALAPGEENVKTGKYPISRPLYVYTAGQPQGKVKEIVDFMIGQDGQRIVEEQGYVPITEK